MRSAIVAACLLAPSVAFAHASLVYPPARTTELKAGPCGAANSTRGTNVTTLVKGSTITVKWTETIEHPGHYRISFDTDGQDFYTPTSFTENTEGQLNVIKDLIPDISGTAPHSYQVDITLPDVECTNCTLQMIQMMTDKPPYTLPPNSDDIYYNCADITLVAANNMPDAGMAAMPDAGADMGSNNGSGGGGEISGGCSATGNASGLLALVGLVGLRRRRR